MYSHAINKQVFEFTCKNGAIAEDIQKEFIHYTSSQINNVISDILTEQVSEESTLSINEIEIDLGDISLPDFGKDVMLDKLRAILSEKIISIQNSNHAIAPLGMANKEPIPGYRTDLEIIKSFILQGDVPWWVDKSVTTDPDTILKDLILKSPQAVKLFLEAQQWNTTVLFRIATQFKPATKAMINTLITHFIPVSLNTALLEDYTAKSNGSFTHVLSPESIGKLISAFSKETVVFSDTRKVSLIHKLLKGTNPNWVRDVVFFNLFSADEIETVKAFFAHNNKTNQNAKKYVIKLLKKLNVFQIEFLYHYALNTNKTYLYNDTENGYLTNTEDDNYLKFPSANSITNPLKADNTFDSTNKVLDNTDQLILNDKTNAITANDYNNPSNEKLHESALRNDTYTINPEESKLQNQEHSDQNTLRSDTHAIYPDESQNALRNDSPTIQPDESILQNQEHIRQNSLRNDNDRHKVHPDESKLQNQEHIDQNSLRNNTPVIQPNESKLERQERIYENSLRDDTHAIQPDEIKLQQKDPAAFSEVTTTINGQPDKTFINIKVPIQQADESHYQKDPDTFLNAVSTANDPSKANTALQNPIDNVMQKNNESESLSSPHGEKNNEQPVPKITPLINEDSTPVSVKTDLNYNAAISERDKNENLNKTQETEDKKKIKKQKQISFFMKSLGSSNQGLFNYFEKINKTDIYKLKKTFTKYIPKDVEYKKILNSLLQHPYLPKYNLIKIFATLSFPKEDREIILAHSSLSKSAKSKKTRLNNLINKIELSQAFLLTALKELSVKETLILQDIFQKKAFDSTNEKSLMRRILLKFPKDAIVLLHFFTELPENELQYLVPPDSNAVFPNNWLQPEESFSRYEDNKSQKFYIANAGLCLIAPYLSGLFNHLEYFENQIFKNKFIITRALFVLQYIATGKYKTPEYLLHLNKLLCGINPVEGIVANIRLTKKEITEANDLIESVITNWKTLKNTSVQGFRESFLQRKGILFQNELSWTLQVEKKGHDLLLNTIPWGFNMIKLPWMKKMIQVEW